MPRPVVLLTPAVDHPRTPVVVAARRTPIGTAGRSLAGFDVTDLAAPVLQALVRDVRGMTRSEPDVDEVVLGNCMGPGGDPARVAALAAGLGVEVPAVTVDRQCGSGLEAVSLAAARVVTGAALVLAGGVESASTAPLRSLLAADGSRVPYDRARFAPDELGDPGMGEAAEALASARSVSRQRQDAYAVRSHRLAVATRDAGGFDDELVPLRDRADGSDDADGGPLLVADDRPRRGLDVATLARFRPAFAAHGTVTAGNSCGINDGAAVVALVDERTRALHRLPGLAVRAVASCGVDPRLPGLGPVPAVRAVLRAASLTLDDVSAFEVTEAFAAQVLACTDELGLDPLGADADRVCPQGGAIALGHPWGASGALLVVRLFASLVREDGGRFGLATCAVGGGQGVAVLFERVG